MSILDQIRHKTFSIVAYGRLHPQQVYLFKVLNDVEKYRTPLANALSNIKKVEALLEEEAFK